MKRTLIVPLFQTSRKCLAAPLWSIYSPRHCQIVVRYFSATRVDGPENPFQQFSTKTEVKSPSGQSFPGLKEMLDKISQQSWKQFFIRSGLFCGGVAFIVYVVFWIWGEYLRNQAVRQTTVVAHETLSSDEVSKKVVNLSNQVAQSLLENPQVLAQVTEFSKKLILMDQTKRSATDLAIYAINADNTRAAAADLAKQVAGNIMADPATQLQLADLLRRAVAMEENKQALYIQLKNLVDDAKTQQLLIDLAKHVVFQTLHDPEVRKEAIQFMTDVLKDQKLHNKGGEAIWQAVKVAFTPSIFQSKPLPALEGIEEGTEKSTKITEPIVDPPELSVEELQAVVSRSAASAAETLGQNSANRESAAIPSVELTTVGVAAAAVPETFDNHKMEKKLQQLSSELSKRSKKEAISKSDGISKKEKEKEKEQNRPLTETLTFSDKFDISQKSEALLEKSESKHNLYLPSESVLLTSNSQENKTDNPKVSIGNVEKESSRISSSS